MCILIFIYYSKDQKPTLFELKFIIRCAYMLYIFLLNTL